MVGSEAFGSVGQGPQPRGRRAVPTSATFPTGEGGPTDRGVDAGAGSGAASTPGLGTREGPLLARESFWSHATREGVKRRCLVDDGNQARGGRPSEAL